MTQPQKTAVDYLAIRTQADPRRTLDGFRPLFGSMAHMLRLEPLRHGKHGYQGAAEIRLGDLRVGRMDFGGEVMRGWVRAELEGEGCSWVQDWDAIESVESLPDAEIRRIDPALTTYRGEVTHERVVAAHAAGGFTARGRPPNLRQEVNSDAGKGRTCYIGERSSDKFGRCYEKGLQLVQAFPEGMREGAKIDGHPVEGIYRCEVELKAKTRPIPWEVVERRDEFFAGAYPFFAELLPGVESGILQPRERAPQLALSAALAQCRRAYGNILFTALHAYQGDIGAVWDRIIGDKHSGALLAAGVLMVEHDGDERAG